MDTNSIHVTCGIVVDGRVDDAFDVVLWSETLSAPGTSVNVVPPKPTYLTGHVKIPIEVYAPAGALLAVGSAPNPNGSPSFIAPEHQNYRVSAFPGDRLAWAYLVQQGGPGEAVRGGRPKARPTQRRAPLAKLGDQGGYPPPG